MADRTVSVRMRMDVGSAISAARAFGTAVADSAKTAVKATAAMSAEIDAATGRQKQAYDRVGRTATIAAIGLVGAFALATRATMNFDKQMSSVAANTGAHGRALDSLRQSAIKAGQATAFSATEAAQGEDELAKAGVSVTDIVHGGLAGALNLAAAGQISVADAAETAATAMTQFHLSGSQVPHIADLLSAAANKAQGSVGDMSFALKQGGLVASQFGLSVEDTVGTLASFASAGLTGSDAGTSFKTMLLSLANPSQQAADTMKQLGINAYDAQGNFVGITDLAGQLHDKLSGLTQAQRNQALATIFGSDAIRAANVLYKQGAGGIQAWINKVNDAGNASRTASTKMNNLAGDVEQLKGSFETALIQGGSGANGALRGLVQGATSAVNVFSAMPGPLQSAAVELAGVSGAGILAAKGVLSVAGTVRDTKEAWSGFKTTLASASKESRLAAGAQKALGLATKAGPYLIAGAAMVYLVSKMSSVRTATDGLIDKLQGQYQAVGNNIQGYQQYATALRGYITQQRAAYNQLKESMPKGPEAFRGGGPMTSGQLPKPEALQKLEAAYKAAQQAQTNIRQGAAELGKEFGVTSDKAIQLANAAGVDMSKGILKSGQLTGDARQKITAYQAAVAAAADPTKRVADDMDQASNSSLLLSDRIKAVSDALEAFYNPAKDAWNATTQLKAGMTDLMSAMSKARGDFSGNSQASQKLRNSLQSQLDTVAALNQALVKTKGFDAAHKASEQQIQVLYALAGKSKAAREQIDTLAQSLQLTVGKSGLSHDAFIKAAAGMDVSRAKAEQLWKAYQRLPSVVKTTLTADDADFLSKLHTVQGLRIDPKTGLLLGNNSDYFNKWLRAKGLKLDPKTGRFVGNNADYYNKWLAANHLHIDTKTGRIVGNTTSFWNSVHAIPQVVGSRTIALHYAPPASANEPGTTRHADGAIERYAGGGMRHDLPPHIVKQPTVLYGEPETGGEAYIPLGARKRHRSTLLLSDVARIFGYELVKPGVAMADGGIRAYANGGTTSDFNLSSILSAWTNAVKPSTKAQVDAALKSRRTQLSQLANAEDALARARRRGNARDIAAAERRVANERKDVADPTAKLTDVENRYRFAKQKPATQLGSALSMDIKAKAAFIRNLTTLTDRGFGPLAQQLLAMGDAQAEKIAADAVKLSDSKLAKLNTQVGQAQQQATQLANLPAILTARAAIKAGQGGSWVGLLAATGLSPDVLALAVNSMLTDLGKTTQGKALIADMHAHGYAHGGPIIGRPGTDTNLIRATAGEFMVREGPARRYRPWLDAMNGGEFDQFVRHLVSGGSGARPAAAPAPVAAGPTIHNTFPTQEMDTAELSRNVSREIAWQLG